MFLRQIMVQAKKGRPDLAAVNLGVSAGNGMLSHPVRFLRVIRKYPHSSGQYFKLSELYAIYCEARDNWRDE